MDLLHLNHPLKLLIVIFSLLSTQGFAGQNQATSKINWSQAESIDLQKVYNTQDASTLTQDNRTIVTYTSEFKKELNRSLKNIYVWNISQKKPILTKVSESGVSHVRLTKDYIIYSCF